MPHAPFACLQAPNLPIQIECQRRRTQLPLLIPHPLNPSVIFACSPEAAEAGVSIGLSVYQAKQMVPHALLIEPDEMAYHTVHAALLAALQAYSPLCETVGLDEFLLDIRAVVRAADGDAGLAAALAGAAAVASGLVVHVGLASSRFTAMQAAQQAPANAALIVPEGGEAAFLAPLSLSVLPGLSGEMRRRLAVLDLYTLGDLSALSKAAVLRQFGGEISGAYELARGRDPRPLNPDAPPLRLVRSLRLSSPAASRPVLLAATSRLARQMSKTLAAKGYHAEGLKLSLYTEGGHTLEAGQPAKPPSSDEARLGRLAALLLGRLQVSAPVAVVALSAYPLRSWHIGAHQISLAEAGVPEKLVQFEAALQLLMHRFGETILRVAAFLGPPLPMPLEVELNAQGVPVRLCYAGRSRVVLAVDEHWREERNWWAQPVCRDHFRLRLAGDAPCNIFQDLISRDWYLDRERHFLL